MDESSLIWPDNFIEIYKHADPLTRFILSRTSKTMYTFWSTEVPTVTLFMSTLHRFKLCQWFGFPLTLIRHDIQRFARFEKQIRAHKYPPRVTQWLLARIHN